MTQKTAMMELIEMIDGAKLHFQHNKQILSALDSCKLCATDLLEKEKEQIINAYDASQMEEWTDKDGLTWLSFYANANHYYNWKYKGQIISDEK